MDFRAYHRWLDAIVGLAGQTAARCRIGGVVCHLSRGLGFAFQAAVTKVFVTQLGYGLGAILSTWITYALILSALAGFALQQSALKTGFLAPAMAACNASTLAMSVLLGVTLFQETISHGQGRLPPALFGLALAIVGVVLLASPDPRRQEVAIG
jgi:hypothetical protein